MIYRYFVTFGLLFGFIGLIAYLLVGNFWLFTLHLAISGWFLSEFIRLTK